VQAHPDWTFTALLRRTPPSFTTVYPGVRILHGDYDSIDTLTAAAEDADIVVHCGDSDHEGSLNALLAGLKRRTVPGFLVHLSGTGIVADWAEEEFQGRLNPRVWSDAAKEDVEAIRNLPEGRLHRNTEKILNRAVREKGEKVNVAVMCPPDIYGKGRGPGKTSSALVPLFVSEARKRGHVFFVEEGENRRSWVHVDDLMRVYSKVVEAAASGDKETVQQYFGENGYHFAGTQECSHMDLARKIGEVLVKRGVIEAAEPVRIGLEEVDGIVYWPRFPKLARYLYASNSRTRAERARELWGYEGREWGLLECVEEDVLAALEASK
jgi:nucleoside-diphosphate-sugar epimerase